MTFYTKLCLAENHYILGSMKYMDYLEFMMEIDN